MLLSLATASAAQMAQEHGCHSGHQTHIAAHNSSCPDSTRWMQKVSRNWIAEDATQKGCKVGKNWLKGGCRVNKPIVFLNIGANKGFAVATMMQQFTLNPGFNNMDWLSAMGEHLKEAFGVQPETLSTFLREYCGACRACEDKTKLMPNLTRSMDLDIHAFEIAQPNVRWLRWAFARFGIRAAVVRAAATNVTQRVKIPYGESIEDFGDERSAVRGTEAKMIHHVRDMPFLSPCACACAFSFRAFLMPWLLRSRRVRMRTVRTAANSAATSRASAGSTLPATHSTTTSRRRG